MASINNTLEIALTTGGTVNLNVQPFASAGAFDGSYARVTGTQTLSSNFVISPTGTAVKNMQVKILWEATATLSGNSVIIFGATVPDEIFETASTDTKFIATCIYDGSAWKVVVSVDSAGLGFVGTRALADDAVTTVKITDLNVTTAKINDLAVTTGKIADVGVTTAKIADLGVTTAKIADLNVTTGKIADSGVTTAKIADANVTTAKIADAGVTTAKIADAGVTPTKMSANANRYTRDIRLSFAAAAEVGNINFTMCESCTVDEINVTVLSPAADDTATLIYKDNGGTALTGAQTDITTSYTLGNIISTTPTANNVFSAGDNFLIEMSKTTKTSCIVNVALCITKT